MTIMISLVADKDLVGHAAVLAVQAGGEASAPEPESLQGALNAGITIEGVRAVLEVVTLAFAAGQAGIEFLKALRDYMRAEAPAAQAAIGNAADGTPAGVVRAATEDAELQRIASQLGG